MSAKSKLVCDITPIPLSPFELVNAGNKPAFTKDDLPVPLGPNIKQKVCLALIWFDSRSK
jgi:hypothetical protein